MSSIQLSCQLLLPYREEREKLLNKIALSFVFSLVEQTALTEIGIIAKDSLKLAEFRQSLILPHVIQG